jgi:hypothetical protein
MKNYGNNKVAGRDNGSNDLKTNTDSLSKDAPEEESDHLPFWSGMGLCYEGKVPSKNEGKYTEQVLAFDLPKRKKASSVQDDPPVEEMGTPVTRSAANAMVKGYPELFKKELGDKLGIEISSFTDAQIFSFMEAVMPYSVVFGKEALLFILAQKGCKGIRYYFCKNHKGKPSLVFVGIKSFLKDFGGGKNGRIIDDADPIPDPVESNGNAGTSKFAARQKTPIVEVGGTDPKLSAAAIYS